MTNLPLKHYKEQHSMPTAPSSPKQAQPSWTTPSLGHAIGRAAHIIPTDSGLLLPIKASYNEGTYRALLQDTAQSMAESHGIHMRLTAACPQRTHSPYNPPGLPRTITT
jgi:hypothetical protein